MTKHEAIVAISNRLDSVAKAVSAVDALEQEGFEFDPEPVEVPVKTIFDVIKTLEAAARKCRELALWPCLEADCNWLASRLRSAVGDREYQ